MTWRGSRYFSRAASSLSSSSCSRLAWSCVAHDLKRRTTSNTQALVTLQLWSRLGTGCSHLSHICTSRCKVLVNSCFSQATLQMKGS